MKKIFVLLSVFLLFLSFSQTALARDYDLDLGEISLDDSRVCKGEEIEASVNVYLDKDEREDVKITWYIDGDYYSSETIHFRHDDRKTVYEEIDTDDLSKGRHTLKVKAKIGSEQETETKTFYVELCCDDYDLDVLRPEISRKDVYEGYPRDIAVKSRVRFEADEDDDVSVELKVYVYDNSHRSGSAEITKFGLLQLSGGSVRSKIFYIPTNHLSEGVYYVFVRAEYEVCGDEKVEWSDYSIFHVGGYYPYEWQYQTQKPQVEYVKVVEKIVELQPVSGYIAKSWDIEEDLFWVIFGGLIIAIAVVVVLILGKANFSNFRKTDNRRQGEV